MRVEDMLGPSQLVLIGAILVAIGGFWSASKTQHFQMEVKAKNEKIEELNNYILSSITGGDSFCYLLLSSINNANNSALSLVVSEGKYPLYDVGFRIVDLDEFNNIKNNPTFENISKTERHINVGNISPASAAMLGSFNLGSGNEKKYNIFISARNGYFTELLRLKRINGEWKIAIKVIKSDGAKEAEVFKRIDEKYPKATNGDIHWK